MGEILHVKNFRHGHGWFVKGIVTKVLGPYRYLVKVGSRCHFVHAEHPRKTGEMDIDVSREYVMVSVPVAKSMPASQTPESVTGSNQEVVPARPTAEARQTEPEVTTDPIVEVAQPDVPRRCFSPCAEET